MGLFDKFKKAKTNKMDINNLINNLRTNLLWENASEYIEKSDYVNILLQKVNLGQNDTVKSSSMQDCEDFYITNILVSDNRIVLDFEMPFIVKINKKYNIEAVAIGKLNIPDTNSFRYDKYDFSTMNKKELLSFGNIICISKVEYENVEFIGEN